MEFFSPLNQALLASGAARMSVFKPPDPNRVNGGDEATRTETNPQDSGRDAANADHKRIADRLVDPDRLAGPPPSFEVSVLEQELDFKRTIARLESAHNQARDAEAVRPDSAPTPERKGSIEPSSGLDEANGANLANESATPSKPDTMTPPFLFGSQ